GFQNLDTSPTSSRSVCDVSRFWNPSKPTSPNSFPERSRPSPRRGRLWVRISRGLLGWIRGAGHAGGVVRWSSEREVKVPRRLDPVLANLDEHDQTTFDAEGPDDHHQ